MATPRVPLIDAVELITRLDEPRLRLADVRWVLGEPGRGYQAFREGHIPGATFVDLDADLSAAEGAGRHPLPDPTSFARRMGELGFGDHHGIVVYDDASGTVAARLWWMLDALGHPDVSLLDGGIDAYLASGGTLTTRPTAQPPAALTLGTAWPRTVDREAVSDRSGGRVLLDLRAPERYRGEFEPVDPVAGHIPGARNLPAVALLQEDKRMLPPERLRRRLVEVTGAAAVRAGHVVMSCGSGVTACLGAVAMRAAGLPDPLLYPGSYSDWSRSGMPTATAEEHD